VPRRHCRYLRLIDRTPRIWCDALDMNTSSVAITPGVASAFVVSVVLAAR
jgi:hypothetical protein